MKGWKRNSTRLETSDRIVVQILAFIVSVIPLTVYMKLVQLDGIMKFAWTGKDTHADFFSYWKSQLIIICLGFLFILLIYSIIKRGAFSVKKIYIPLMIYTLMVFLSAIFAEHREVAFGGFVERYEGAWVLLGYVVFTLSAALVIKDEKSAKPIMIALFISCTLMAFLGLTQFYGIDFFQTGFGSKLILPKIYEEHNNLKFTFANQQIMYTTVYNPNYVGSYSAILFPLILGFYYTWAHKRGWRALLVLFFVACTFALLLGSLSRAGLLGSFGAVIVFIVFFRKQIIKLWPYTIALFVVLSAVYFTMNLTSGGKITKEVENTLPSAIQYYTEEDKIEETQDIQPGKFLESIDLKGISATVRTETESLTVTHNQGTLLFTGTDGEILDFTFDGEKYHFLDPSYSLYNIKLKGAARFDIVWNKVSIPIIILDGNLYISVNDMVAIEKIDKPETFGFEGLEKFASNRGYIWSRSIPLLKETLILGKGPDTYLIYFPQHEITAKVNFLKKATIIIDKPHNWYLQMGINTGVVSLVAMLVFLAWYIIKGFFVWIKDVGNAEKAIGASILCGTIGYCVAALFNDSTVSVAPVFWVLLGIGISFLYKYAPEKRKA